MKPVIVFKQQVAEASSLFSLTEPAMHSAPSESAHLAEDTTTPYSDGAHLAETPTVVAKRIKK